MIPVFINDTLQSNVTLKCKLVYKSNSLPKVDTKNYHPSYREEAHICSEWVDVRSEQMNVALK